MSTVSFMSTVDTSASRVVSASDGGASAYVSTMATCGMSTVVRSDGRVSSGMLDPVQRGDSSYCAAALDLTTVGMLTTLDRSTALCWLSSTTGSGGDSDIR